MREIYRNDSIVKISGNTKISKLTLDNEIQNEIMTSMNNLKEQNTLSSSLQQKVSKTLMRNRIFSISAEKPLFFPSTTVVTW